MNLHLTVMDLIFYVLCMTAINKLMPEEFTEGLGGVVSILAYAFFTFIWIVTVFAFGIHVTIIRN